MSDSRVVVAGAGAALGLLVMSLFELIAVAIAVGLGLVVALGAAPDAKQLGIGAAVAAVIAVWGAWRLGALFRTFTRVQIGPGGEWRLRNAWGMTVGRISGGAARRLTCIEHTGWVYGAMRRFRDRAIEIETEDRVYRSWRQIPARADTALRALSEAIQS